jgi:hypothetical protein
VFEMVPGEGSKPCKVTDAGPTVLLTLQHIGPRTREEMESVVRGRMKVGIESYAAPFARYTCPRRLMTRTLCRYPGKCGLESRRGSHFV